MTIPLKKIKSVYGYGIVTASLEIKFGYWGLWSFYRERGAWELYAFGFDIMYWNILENE
jgi:hypothetical protein